MPQDTTYKNPLLPDTVQRKDSVQQTVVLPGKTNPDQNGSNGGEGMAIGIYLVFILTLIIIPALITFIRPWMARKKLAKLYESREMIFDNLLQHYNPYYQSLDGNGKARFMKRLLDFMETKEFRYIDLEQEEIMPLLISAAAVQLTFGLEHYKMDYFSIIYVVRDIYTYGLYNIPFEGHVSDDGIYLSWKNFMRDNRDYTDGENVGLHELAHALAYVNFTVADGRDNGFREKFQHYSAVAKPVFEGVQSGAITFFNAYAATNFNEFWAVSVETFFEKAAQFRQQLPELYSAICELLNQDPLTTRKLISSIQND